MQIAPIEAFCDASGGGNFETHPFPAQTAQV
jgi:hypothetical protein